MLRGLRWAGVTEQNLLLGCLESQLVLPLIANDNAVNDGDNVGDDRSPDVLRHEARDNDPQQPEHPGHHEHPGVAQHVKQGRYLGR